MVTRPDALPSTIQSRRARGWPLVLLTLLALIVCGFAAYQRAFSTFAEYDDEGYVMLSLKQHLAGGTLYDDVYSQYGPAWYIVQSGVHGLTSLPVTHDVTRFKTIVVWLGVSLMAAFTVYRLADSVSLGFAALAMSFLHLDRLVLEPGHPQELCLLVLAGVMATGTTSFATRRSGLILLGVLIGTAVMTKLNAGLLLVAAISLTMLLTTRAGRVRAVGTALLTLGVCAGALIVTRSTFSEPGGLQLPLVVIGATVAVATFSSRQRQPGQTTVSEHLILHSVWVLTAVGFVAATLARGTTADALLQGMILQHLGFATRFYTAAPVYVFAAPLALIAAASVVMLTRKERQHPHLQTLARIARLAMLALLAGVALRHLTDASTPLEHGFDDRGHAGLIMSLVAGFSWVILLPVGGDANRRFEFGRLLLASIAALQPLIAYPMPGTQMAMGSLPMLLIALICVRDLVVAEVAASGDAKFELGVRIVAFAAPAALLLVACSFAMSYRAKLEPLRLAGAERLCVHPLLAAELRDLVSEIRENGDTFISLHNGYNSLYLLADIEPPTGLNATFWPWMLSDTQQHRVVAALDRTARVVSVEKVIPGRLEPPVTPLGTFLSRGFTLHSTVGFWKVRVREPAVR